MEKDTHYYYEVKYQGVKEGIENPAYHIQSIMVAALDAFANLGIIENYNIDILKVSTRTNEKGEKVEYLS